jgi:hypothetical protein
MPIRSQAQRGAMYAAAAGKSTLGIPKSVGQEFVASDKPGKLPEKVAQKRKPQGATNYTAMVNRAKSY